MLLVLREGEVYEIATQKNAKVFLWTVKNGFQDVLYETIPENYTYLLGPFLNETLFNVESVGSISINRHDNNFLIPRKLSDYEPVYAHFYYDSDTPIVLSLPVANDWYQISLSSLTTDKLQGIEVVGSDVITRLGSSGLFEVSYSISYSTGSNSQTNIGKMFLNDIPVQGASSRTKVQQASSVLSSGMKAQTRINAGDKISMKMKSDLDNATINVYNFNATLNRIGS